MAKLLRLLGLREALGRRLGFNKRQTVEVSG